MIKGSSVEPHYHNKPNQWEMFTILQGRVEVQLSLCNGNVKEPFYAGDGRAFR